MADAMGPQQVTIYTVFGSSSVTVVELYSAIFFISVSGKAVTAAISSVTQLSLGLYIYTV